VSKLRYPNESRNGRFNHATQNVCFGSLADISERIRDVRAAR
jgi:hypothetical protein